MDQPSPSQPSNHPQDTVSTPQPTPSTSTPSSTPETKNISHPASIFKSKTLLLPLALLITTTITILAYFLYQNQQQAPVEPDNSASPQDMTASTPNPRIYSTSPDQINDWQTFSPANTTFQLPPDWHQSDSQQPFQFLNYDPSQSPGRSFDPESDQGNLKIEIYTVDTQDTLEAFVQKQKLQTQELGQDNFVWNTTPLEINNTPAIKVKTNQPGFSYIFKHPQLSKIYIMTFALDFDNYQELSNQILSTFEFSPNTANNCPANYSHYETDRFSFCYPNYMHDPKLINNSNITHVRFVSGDEELIVSSNFEGGWGGSPCMETEDITILNYPSKRLTWKIENSESCEADYKNFVTLINSGTFSNNFPYLIDYRGHFVNDEKFKAIENSFRLK